MTTSQVSGELQTNGSSGDEPVTHRDRQRAALRELLELAQQCAAEESEIDRRRQTELETAKRQHDKGATVLQQRQQSEASQTGQRHEEAKGAVQAKRDADAAALKNAERNSRQKIESTHEPIVRKVKEKLSQELWLADSVFEVSQNQVKSDLKKAKSANEKLIDALDEMEARAKALMGKYHQAVPVAPDVEPPVPQDVDAAFKEGAERTEAQVAELRRLSLPNLFVGAWPYLAILTLCVLAGVGGYFYNDVTGAGEFFGGALVVGVLLGWLLFMAARKQARQAYLGFLAAGAVARKASALRLERITAEQDKKLKDAVDRRKTEIAAAKEKMAPVLSNAEKQRLADLASIEAQVQHKGSRLLSAAEKARAETKASIETEAADLSRRHANEVQAFKEKYQTLVRDSEARHAESRQALEAKWSGGLARIAAPMGEAEGARTFPAWDDPGWQKWIPPKTFPPAVRFGELHVDLKKIVDSLGRDTPFTLPLPGSFILPAMLTYPNHASMLIEASRDGREESLRTLQMVMMRLLTSIPPGRVHFTIVDPVGLGKNFAGFMHLADHDEALVGTRIWTDADEIEQKLGDLTDHMETVIQKYLRNEFETIDDYNAQAGELSEPYRYLVIADFPVRFEGESFRRLNSIASSGARCGVYTLIMRDLRVTLPAGTHMDDVESHSVTLAEAPPAPGAVPGSPQRFLWKDEIFRQFPLLLDAPPSEEFLTRILTVVGQRAKESKRVELAFETIAPKPEEFWTLSTAEELRVPIGRSGATRLQMLRLGKGVAQHGLIAGKTGSGKSTLLHAMITNLAMWYSPAEVEFYLIDFKKGVEFKTYANYSLPHARVIAVESDREFGMSVLQRLDVELARRGNLYRKVDVQDINSYRKSPNAQVMPRTLLIIDEFQELFSEDDKLAQDAQQLIERLVRQGRAFGMHVLLGSQTIGGAGGLSRSTLGQMGVRIALTLSEADSQLILGDNNSAARSLTRPGEAIYNDAGGLVENNSPFQVAYLSDEKKDRYLARVHELASNSVEGHREPLVFEGNAPADITKNRVMESLIAAKSWPAAGSAPVVAWLGDPVAIKDPTALAFRRQSGSNAILVGQADEGAMALMAAAVTSLSVQLPPAQVSFVVLDGSAADSPTALVFPRLKEALPHDIKLVEYRLAGEGITEVGAEFKRRQDEGITNAPAIFIIVYGLQRYRVLRKTEDSSFSFSPTDADKPVAPDKTFGELIREGPTYGIHVLIWVDTPVSIDRTFERGILREFDHRILFQMSANDSGAMIDSPTGNKLGPYRALAYSEEQGTMEKFRPYAAPTKEWLDRVHASLASRAGA
jgi:energy-coupling factor transporter ATP-binding protein EcfA2